jgi:hypothetical protein
MKTKPKKLFENIHYIRIENDVNKYFKTSEEVNNALRTIINIIPKRNQKKNTKKPKT